MDTNCSLTIQQLCALYEQHARTTFIKPSTGQPTATWKNIRSVGRALCAAETPAELRPPLTFAALSAAQFNAKLLYHWQQQLAAPGGGRYNRNTVNDYVRWVKTMFAWAAHPVRGLVPETIIGQLALIKSLTVGRTQAPEPKQVQSVAYEDVRQTCMYAPEKLAVMIQVQWFTGMRPGELVAMRKSELDVTTQPWIYQPGSHKCEHFKKLRLIALGARAQDALLPWMAKVQTDCLFEGRHCGEPTGEPMKRLSYYRAIDRLNEAHHLMRWTPNQIRHTFATRVDKHLGRKMAKELMGHSNERTTTRYIDPETLETLRLIDDLPPV